MRIALPLLSLVLLLAVPASGQGFLKHDSKAPIDVLSQRQEVLDREGRVIFSGNVRITQGSMNMNADRVTVIYDRQGGNTDIQRIDASGGVSVVSPGESARGEFAVYDLPRGLITVVGGVDLAKDGNRVSGGRMVIDLNAGRSVIEGGGPGTDGRVSGHFTVSKRDQ
ncbi:MAG: hypothetical protein RL367_2711 [Pseudomonadota bacterium]|jgi:lipopolysaccharide export system protein LptA